MRIPREFPGGLVVEDPALSLLGLRCDLCPRNFCMLQMQQKKKKKKKSSGGGKVRTYSLFSDCHCPVRGEIFSPMVGIEALRIRLCQVPFPLNVCPAPKEGDPCPQRGPVHHLCRFRCSPKSCSFPCVVVSDLAQGCGMEWMGLEC